MLTERYHHVVHHSRHKDPHTQPVPLEHLPSWVHEHPKTVLNRTGDYTFAPFTYDESVFARFEGRHHEGGKLDAYPKPPPALTTHAGVEMPPHVDVSSEHPPPQANVPKTQT